MKFKVPGFEKAAVFLIFLFYASTNSFWAYRLFHESNIFPALASLIPVFLLLCHYRKTRLEMHIGLLLTVFSIYFVIVLWSSFSFKMILFYGMCVTLMLNTGIAEKPEYLKYFYYLALIFAVGSFINLFLPGVYRSVILPAFSGSSQYLKLKRWSRSFRIIPGFANQTSFNAPHFVYGIGFILCANFTWRKKQKLNWLILAVLFLCLILTNKRGQFVFLLVSLVAVYYISGAGVNKSRRVLILIAAGILVYLFMLYLLPKLNIGVFFKLNTMLEQLENNEDITHGRLDLYRLAIEYFLKNPIIGIGWEGFRKLPGLQGGQTHNIYLELLCETGIIGFSFFSVFFIYAFVTAMKNCSSARSESDRFLSRFCLFMQLFFLLYGISGNPLYDPPYYIPYFIACTYSFSQRILFRKARALSLQASGESPILIVTAAETAPGASGNLSLNKGYKDGHEERNQSEAHKGYHRNLLNPSP